MHSFIQLNYINIRYEFICIDNKDFLFTFFLYFSSTILLYFAFRYWILDFFKVQYNFIVTNNNLLN